MSNQNIIIPQDYKTSLQQLQEVYKLTLISLKDYYDKKDDFDLKLYATYQIFKPLMKGQSDRATLTHIGKSIGMSYERVRQTINKVKAKGGVK